MAMSAPYGSWASPITSDLISAGGVRLGSVTMDGHDIYFLESRPTEGGRNALVRCRADGTTEDVTPPGTNVRTRVHEYGGAAYRVWGGTVLFSGFADQRLYRLDRGGSPVAI